MSEVVQEILNKFQSKSSVPQKTTANSPWRRGETLMANMTHDQILWTMRQKTVKAAEQDMKENFESFLFAMFKEDFAIAQDGAFAPSINAYLDSLARESCNYNDRNNNLEEENQKLKEELAKLKGGKL